MRTAFIETLCELAAEDERIWLLTGDLGYSVLEQFADRFPGQYVNAGIAEQNMTGMAAGLAFSGKIPFTYSIANFPTLRCLEQVRNDACYHNLPVKIVAVGGGVAYGSAGYTHYGVEDLAVMRALPNMTVVAPGDPVETRLATRAIAEHAGPCYLRLGKGREPVVHADPPEFRLGEAIPVRDGSDGTIVTTGGMLSEAVKAADLAASRGLSVGVISMPTVAPLDEDAVVQAAARSEVLCVAEEHAAVGGLSDAVARCLVGRAHDKVCFMTLDIPSLLDAHQVGGQAYLVSQAGLVAEAMVDRIAGVVGHEAVDH